MQTKAWARGRAHWTLFAPAVLVAFLYGLIWLVLAVLGRGDGAVARICILVFSIGSPLLLVYGFLRYNSVWIVLAGDELCLARGWPRLGHIRILLGDISSIRLLQSFIGRRFGVGEVLVEMQNGRRYRVSDIGAPDVVVRELNEALKDHQNGQREAP